MAGLDHAHLPGNIGKLPWGFWYRLPLYDRPKSGRSLLILTVALMASLFTVDALLKLPFSVGVLYGFAILLMAGFGRVPWVVGTAIVSAALVIVAFRVGHRDEATTGALIRCLYGLALQAVTLGLVVRGMLISRVLLDQAKLLDQTHDSVVLRRLDATLLYWNRGATELYGWTFEEARQHSQAQLIGTGSTLPPMPIEEFIVHGPWRGEITVFAKDGRRMMIDCHCSLMHDERGRPFAVLTTGNDVTERHEAEEKLRRSEIRYRNIFQTTGIGVLELNLSGVRDLVLRLVHDGVTDLRSHFRNHPEVARAALEAVVTVDVNEAAVGILGGASKNDLFGTHNRLWPPESMPMFIETVIAAREGRPSAEIEVKLHALDGRWVDCFLSLAFPPESASRESVFITVTDITARTAANAALRSAQADLAHSSRLTSLGELAACIAHEVKQPVAGILAHGQAGGRWLRRDPPDLEGVATSLAGVVDEAKRAGAVISGVRALAQSRLSAPAPFDVAGLIEETLRLVGHELVRKGVSARTDFDPDLRPVFGDRVQIQQVLINLVLNAIEAMSSLAVGERLLTLEVSLDDQFAVVTVADTGPGIEAEMRPGLFTAFSSSRAEGMGLGLSICATIIARHEGRIWLDEQTAGGARFVFTLPFVEPTPSPEAAL